MEVLKLSFHIKHNPNSKHHFYYHMVYLSKLLVMHNTEYQFEYIPIPFLQLLIHLNLPILHCHY